VHASMSLACQTRDVATTGLALPRAWSAEQRNGSADAADAADAAERDLSPLHRLNRLTRFPADFRLIPVMTVSWRHSELGLEDMYKNKVYHKGEKRYPRPAYNIDC